jgi:hypothetical protein
MLTRTLTAFLLGGVLTTSAIPEPKRVHTDVEYSPYAFYATNQVPISASDYAAAGDERVDLAEEHPNPGDKTIYQILNAVPQQVLIYVSPLPSLISLLSFSKLAKVVNISDEIVSLLNDSSAGSVVIDYCNEPSKPTPFQDYILCRS